VTAARGNYVIAHTPPGSRSREAHRRIATDPNYRPRVA
jgi:hypothetical protein